MMKSSEINSDIAFEILTRTDIKGLDLCRAVCKEWNDISFESSFTSTHCERTDTISGYFIQYPRTRVAEFVAAKESNREISFGFLPIELRIYSKIVASTKQGILCCKSNEYRKEGFFVCKPSTQQWVMLPPSPKMQLFTEKVGMAVVGSNPLHYKIIRVSRPNRWKNVNGLTNSICEMFDSKKWRWMNLKHLWLPYCVCIKPMACVVVGGSIYWLLSNNYVLEFDTYKNNHTTFPLPQPIIHKNLDYSANQLVEYKGKLAFVYSEKNEKYLSRWILKDGKRRMWQELETISLESMREEEKHASCIGFLNADVAVMSSYFGFYFYNFRNNTFQKFKLRGPFSNDNIFAFRSDSEPTQLSP